MSATSLSSLEWVVNQRGRHGESPRVPTAPPRIVLHTTESPPGTGKQLALNAPYPYHAWVELFQPLKSDGTIRGYQSIYFNKTAYALYHPSGTIETNHMGKACIQICIVGYAANVPYIPSTHLRVFTEQILRPLCRSWGIKPPSLKFWGPNEGVVLATPNALQRIDDNAWMRCNEIVGHQHIKRNDHWDPSKINTELIKIVLKGDPVPAPVGANKPLAPGLDDVVTQFSPEWEQELLHEILNEWFHPSPRLKDDGIVKVGDRTQEVVKAAQVIMNLEADGWWGPLTARTFVAWRRQIVNAVGVGITGKEVGELTNALSSVFTEQRELRNAIGDLRAFSATIAMTPNARRDLEEKLNKLRQELDSLAAKHTELRTVMRNSLKD